MNKKYIFFDIDNTLAVGEPGRQYVPKSAMEAVRKLREAGHFTAIATGRAHAMAEGYRKQFGFDNMVSDGGYGITINGELKELRPLPREACLRLIRECEDKNLAWGMAVDDSDVRITKNDRFYKETGDIYIKTKVVPNLDVRNYPNIYKMYVAGRYPIEKQLTSLKDLPYVRYQDEYFFVEPTYKAVGIRKMVHMLGGDPKDVVVFGDGLNDLSMFSDEWTSIAMGNAVPQLKAKADFVTKDAADGGIYYACEQLGLFSDVRNAA